MDRPLQFIEQLAGGLLVLFVLLDVFLTVLYARMGSALWSRSVAFLTWRTFRAAAARLGRWQPVILSYCGPVILVLIVFTWSALLIVGMGLVVHPGLGTGITATNGETPTNFLTALYVTGDSMTTVGTSDMGPRSGFYRFCYTVTSFLGITMITLTLTYFIEVYSAVQTRNTFCLKMHTATAETGDAAEFIAALGPQGNFQGGYSQLAEVGAEVAQFKEMHHFYPVVFYFRFAESHYAMARLALLMLDTVSLLRAGLSDKEFRWLQESAAVSQLWHGAMMMLRALGATFIPGGIPEGGPDYDAATCDRWRRRYLAATHRFRKTGIAVRADEEDGVRRYIELRARWEHYVRAFAAYMSYQMEEVDPAGCDPEGAQRRVTERTRLALE
jgi:hypothetical protein